MCSSGLMYKISETVIYGYPERQLIIKHEPHFECSKCGFTMQAEPDQSKKNEFFFGFSKIDLAQNC